MTHVLAIEPDPRQAGILKRIVREQVPADLVVSASKDAAVASISERVPDLILVSALMSPREEAELSEHLRTLENAEHLQTLTIPLLASKPAQAPSKKGTMLRALTGRRGAQLLEGCDPSVFAEEIRGYLDRAGEVRAERALERAAAAEDVATEVPEATAFAATCDAMAQSADVILADEDLTPAIDSLASIEVLAAVMPAPALEPAITEVFSEHDRFEQPAEPVADSWPPPQVVESLIDEESPILISHPIEIWQSLEEWTDPWPPLEGFVQRNGNHADESSPPAASAERVARGLAAPFATPDSPSEPTLRLVKTDRSGSSQQVTPKSRKVGRSTTKPATARLAEPKPTPTPMLPPVEDEWSIHDPTKCGFDALFERLKAPAAPAPAPQQPNARLAEAPASDSSQPEQNRRLRNEVSLPVEPPRTRAPRRSPLAIWVHAEEDKPEAGAEPDDLRALFASLQVPPDIAAVSYPMGCRIRRIRVAPSPQTHTAAARDKKTIILSRRRLRELRHGHHLSKLEGRT